MSKTDQRVKSLIHAPDRTKPEFITDPNVDKLVAVTMRLAMEISVLRDQLDTQRSLLEAHDILPKGAADSYQPTPEQVAARKASKEALIANMISDLM
jgi:hypothetical protein